jgi:hypothetical protein
MAIGFGHEGTIEEAFIVDEATPVVRRRGMIGWQAAESVMHMGECHCPGE